MSATILPAPTNAPTPKVRLHAAVTRPASSFRQITGHAQVSPTLVLTMAYTGFKITIVSGRI